jgi:hypothetical protein
LPSIPALQTAAQYRSCSLFLITYPLACQVTGRFGSFPLPVLQFLFFGPLNTLHSPCPHSFPVTRPHTPYIRVPRTSRLVGRGVSSISCSCSISGSRSSASSVPSSCSDSVRSGYC